MNSQSKLFQALPSVDSLLQLDVLVTLSEKVGREAVKLVAQSELESLRRLISNDQVGASSKILKQDFLSDLAREVASRVSRQFASTLVPVFNLSGTVIHTNLGRAKLPEEAIAAMELAARESNNLEFDLATGKRGDRDSHLESAICEICGAEAATVVNNNAAAVLLVLSTFALEKEVLISRGELVEIGGSFRIPDVMKSAGCHLKEVGTTNRTHYKDFASAIGERTALIMKVHTSNYEISGFTQSVPESELAELGRASGIPFVSDLGSGTLVDLSQFDLPHEPTVSEELQKGAELVTFSGDKLLGGPQAGIIVGKADLVDRIKRNPLKRALRIDKVTLAALLEVINLYRDPDRISERLPVLRDLTRPANEIGELARALGEELLILFKGKADISVEPCKSQIGSGSLPTERLDSWAITIAPLADKGNRDASLLKFADSLRGLPKPVIGRINDGKLWLDLRCLQDGAAFLSQLQSHLPKLL